MNPPGATSPSGMTTELRSGGVAVVSWTGPLDYRNASTLSSRISALVGEGRAAFVVDLSHTPSVDSAGLGQLVASHRKASGALRLVGVNEHLAALLEQTR